MTFLYKRQSIETGSLCLKASPHFHLANSYSSLKTQFSYLALCEALLILSTNAAVALVMWQQLLVPPQ